MNEFRFVLNRIWNNPLNRVVSIFIIGLSLLFLLGSLLFDYLQLDWLSIFFQGLSTNMFGALLIFLLIELFWGFGKELQQINQELRSTNNLIAKGAIEKARMSGILFDGFLNRQVIWYANWEDANLTGAQLQNSILMYANLKGANLRDANISGVDFHGAKFDVNSILPDGTQWQRDDDLERFTK